MPYQQLIYFSICRCCCSLLSSFLTYYTRYPATFTTSNSKQLSSLPTTKPTHTTQSQWLPNTKVRTPWSSPSRLSATSTPRRLLSPTPVCLPPTKKSPKLNLVKTTTNIFSSQPKSPVLTRTSRRSSPAPKSRSAARAPATTARSPFPRAAPSTLPPASRPRPPTSRASEVPRTRLPLTVRSAAATTTSATTSARAARLFAPLARSATMLLVVLARAPSRFFGADVLLI